MTHKSATLDLACEHIRVQKLKKALDETDQWASEVIFLEMICFPQNDQLRLDIILKVSHNAIEIRNAWVALSL